MSETRPIERPELPKRFYTDVTVAAVEDGFAVALDGRTIKTPLRRALVAPVAPIAEAMALEWTAQRERIDPATMPVTRLANTAIDGVAETVAATRDDLARYAETDMLFYRAGDPDRLVERQRRSWGPIIEWAEGALGVRFLLAEGVIHVAQPPRSVAAVKQHLTPFDDPFAVAALHQMTTLTGSALIALAIAHGHLDIDAAWAAAHIDEDWNIELWGADAEAEARRAARFRDMKAAANVMAALR